MTYDQGRETRHAEMDQKTGVAIYFCYHTAPSSAAVTRTSMA